MMEMLDKITWLQFFLLLGICAVVYYLVLDYLFFKKGVRGWLFKKAIPHKETFQQPEVTTEEETQETAPEQDSFDELEIVVEDIRYRILEKAGNGADKSELLRQLRERLASYDGLRKPAFRYAINNFIVQQAQSICAVAFSEEELEQEWSRLLEH